MATFDTRLKKLRQEKGILQDTLAEDIGVTKGTVSVWERGIRKPDFDTLEKLAGYFDVTIPYLLGDSEYRNSQEIADEDAASWATEDDDEHLTTMAKQYARLSMSSRRIIDGAIAAAYKNDMQAGNLHGADEYSVRINSTWVLKKKANEQEGENGSDS